MIRPALLLLVAITTLACTATPAPSPAASVTPSPTPSVSAPAESSSLKAATTTLLAPYGDNLTLGPNEADPEYPEAVQIFAFSDEWEFDPAADRYGWGRSVDGYVGAGATVERFDTTRFDERVLGSAPDCLSLEAENLQIAGVTEVTSTLVFGYPGKRFTEAYGDGAILAACADLGGGVSLLVRVPDPFYITDAAGVSTPAGEALRSALLAAANPFVD